MVRAATFLRGVMQVAEPRSKFGSKAMQIVRAGRMSWSSKPLFARNAPYTIENPHEGQIEWRIEFGKAARSAEGCSGLEDGLPCVAAAIKRRLKDKTATARLPEDQYPSKVQRSFHTLEDLEVMLELKKKERERRAAALRYMP